MSQNNQTPKKYSSVSSIHNLQFDAYSQVSDQLFNSIVHEAYSQQIHYLPTQLPQLFALNHGENKLEILVKLIDSQDKLAENPDFLLAQLLRDTNKKTLTLTIYENNNLALNPDCILKVAKLY